MKSTHSLSPSRSIRLAPPGVIRGKRCCDILSGLSSCTFAFQVGGSSRVYLRPCRPCHEVRLSLLLLQLFLRVLIADVRCFVLLFVVSALELAIAAAASLSSWIFMGDSDTCRARQTRCCFPVSGTVFAVQPRRVLRQDLGVPVLELRGVAPVVDFDRLISL